MPWNASTLTRGVPASHTLVALTPATGAIAASWPGSAHASSVENMAPFDMPAANTRRGSMQSVRWVVRSIACTNATSGLADADGTNDHRRSASPCPLGVITTSPRSPPCSSSPV